MNGLNITPDEPLWQWGSILLNRTILSTWVVMLILTGTSWLVARRIRSGSEPSRVRSLLEIIVSTLRAQIRDVSEDDPDPFMGFIGTLFLFLATANLLTIIPGFATPTASLSTAAALAACVFIAVPVYGLRRRGLSGYLKQYVQPSVFMLPFNITGELSRTLALAVRLYGNMMSGTVIAAILLGFVPLFVPVLMQLFGLLTGMIQAYIFSVLAMVYIASATRATSASRE